MLGLRLEESDRLIPFLDARYDLIVEKTEERSEACTTLERKVMCLLDFPSTTNLSDVLSLTQKDRDNQLWRFVCWC